MAEMCKTRLKSNAPMRASKTLYLQAYFTITSRSWPHDEIPLKALENPVLFKAIVAFAASHQSRTCGFSSEQVLKLHDACLKDLITALEDFEPSKQAEYLAATCLLRSYEILNGDTRNQDHLWGAFSFAAARSIDLGAWGLVQAGFWNYIREDITVALEFRRPLHMKIGTRVPTPRAMTRTLYDYANTITYILAKIIDFCWGNTRSEETPSDWHFLNEELTTFRTQLPSDFSSYSSAPKPGTLPFRSIWMLRPYHVAANQYLHIASMLLCLSAPLGASVPNSEGTLESYALEIIAICATNHSVPARINAFGPLAFSGRYLIKREHRKALKELLWNMAKETGWNVGHMIRDLCESWGATNTEV
ncbi:MAG: hypothetical protein M1821_003217 [Bathelium mastoideum]|nr:MAG: hypothetical protein M1821_003217 [Bathelium mastoideum]